MIPLVVIGVLGLAAFAWSAVVTWGWDRHGE